MTRRAIPTAVVLALALTVAGCEDFRARQLIHQATGLAAVGKWSEAVHYYERLWVQFPDSPYVDEAQLKAARIYSGPENKVRSAEDIYRALVLEGRTEEVRVTALLELAEMYDSYPDGGDKAMEILELYRQRYPGHVGTPDAALRLAELYLDRGLYFQAVEEARPYEAVRDTTVSVRARLVVGQAQELSHNTTAARGAYAAAAGDAKPGSAMWIAALEGEARVFEEQGALPEALDVLKTLRANHPNTEAVDRWIRAVRERYEEMKR